MSESASGERFRGLVNVLANAVYALEPERDTSGAVVELRYSYVNQASVCLLGRPAVDILGRGLIELFPSVVDLGIFEFYCAALASGLPGRMRIPSFNENGVVGAFDLAASCIGDEIVVVATDVTAELGARAAVEESEARFRGSIDALPDPFFLFAPVRDNDGTIVDLRYEFINAAAERLYDRVAADVVGRGVLELFPATRDVGAFDCYCEPLITGQPSRMRIRAFNQNGVEGSFEIGASRLGDQVIVVATDVTATVIAEQVATESLQRFAAMFETHDAIMLLVDPVSGELVDANRAAAAFYGYPHEQMVGMHIEQINALPAEQIEARRHEAVEGSRNAFIFPHRLADGTVRTVEVHSSPIDDAGRPLLFSIVRDITDDVANRVRLAATEQRLQATLDSLLDPHVMLDPVTTDDGRVVDFVYSEANDAACADEGRLKGDVVGARLLDLQPGVVALGLMEAFQRAVETGQPLALDDFCFPTERRGDERYVDVRAIKVGDSLSLVWRDVTERHHAVEEVTKSEEQYRMLAENALDVVVRTRAGLIVWVSPSLAGALSWSPRDWIGEKLDGFVHPEERGRLLSNRERIQRGEMVSDRYRLRSRNGDFHWVDSNAATFLTFRGEVDGIISSFRIIDLQVAAEHELERLARQDTLTGAWNRSEGMRRLHSVLRRGRRPGDDCAYVDIDGFKAVNDEFGHAAGDELLRTCATRIGASLRRGDIVVRLGGDEFLAILDGVHGLDEAIAVMEKVRLSVGEPHPTPRGMGRRTVSIGVTLASPFESADETINRADQAMYLAKSGGRDCVVAVPAGP
jgi:diguanylate cyclase (GGDEF)-like protein/PAS domain S-box-containing protein